MEWFFPPLPFFMQPYCRPHLVVDFISGAERFLLQLIDLHSSFLSLLHAAMFADPSRPLVIDLGSGPGRFLLLLHSRHSRELQQQQQQQQQVSGTFLVA